MENTFFIKTSCDEPAYQFLPEKWQYIKSILPINVYFPENSEMIIKWLADKQQQIIQIIKDLADSSEQQEELSDFIYNCCQTIQEQSPITIYANFAQELKRKLIPYTSKTFIQREIRVCKYFCNEDLPSLTALQELFERICPTIKTEQKQMEMENPQEDLSNELLFQKYKLVIVSRQQTLKELRENLIQIYNFYGWKIPNFYRPLIFYPDYLNNVNEVLQMIFDKPGPLQRDYIYNIALMTAANQKNLYMFNLFADKTVAYLGNIDFLKFGFQALPKKLSKFWELIYSANQHPKIFLNHYKELFSYLMSSNESGDSWSYNELMFGFITVLFIQYHCTIAHSLSLIFERDSSNWNLTNSLQSPKKKNSTSYNKFQKSHEHLYDFIQKATKIWEENQIIINKDKYDSESCSDDYIDEQIQPNSNNNNCNNTNNNNLSKFNMYTRKSFLMQQFNDTDLQSPDIPRSSLNFSPIEAKPLFLKKESLLLPSNESISTTVSSPGYIKEKKKKRKQKFLSHNDFNWNQNCYNILTEFFPELTELIHKKREIVLKLKANKQGQYKDLDFNLFQIAIWRYVEIIMGYYRDDYKDKKTNSIFQQPFKNFIRKVVFNPSNITQRDWDSIPYLFDAHELIHLLITIAEAKFYTLLINFLYSLDKVMKLSN